MAKQMEQCCRIRCKPLVLAVAGACLSGHVMAADESIYFSDLPMVASVSRLPQRLSEAPGAVTVIDRDIIRASGVRNVADLLRLVPGFQVTPPNQEGAIVAYHGLSNEEYTPRVQVLLDGRSLYSPLFKSGVNWNLLPVAIENIERIEVMRGANGVSYGSNALLGVINIITQDATQTQGWMVSTNHGNNSIRDTTVRWGGKVDESDIRVTARQYGDAGFQKMFDGNLGWFDPHDSRHGNVFDLLATIPLTDRDELKVVLSHVEDVSQFGRPKSASDPFRDSSQNSTAVSFEWRRVVGQDEEIKVRYGHVEDWASSAYRESVSFDNAAGAGVNFTNLNNSGGKSRVDELEFQHLLSIWPNVRMVWGLMGKIASIDSTRQFFGDHKLERTTYRVFGNLEWRATDAWLFNLGGSVEHDSVVGDFFDPRASVNYHITPQNTVRFIASRAHRTPSMFEAYGDSRKLPIGAVSPVDRTYLAVPGLEAERVDTLELGYLGEWKSQRASLDVRAFHERIPNRIQIVPYPLDAAHADDRDPLDAMNRLPIYPYGRADAALNLEKVVIQGYEYQLRWQPLDRTQFLYNSAYIRTYANLLDESVVADTSGSNILKISRQTTESAPRHSQSAMLIQKLPYDFEASLMYYKSGWVRWLRNSFTSPYERVDWRLAKAFNVGSAKAELAYTAQMSNHDMEGRRETRIAKELHWVSLRIDF